MKLVKDKELFWIEWPDKTRSTYRYNETRVKHYMKDADLKDLKKGDEKYYPISAVG